MAYQVLARKWRPQNFSSLVGQEPIVTALRNALTEGRIAHAYLFSGIRGVGKTTAARVLAKALNCERGPAADPCNECPPCIEIARGSDLDVLEVDAATYSKVEQVRELTESLRYGPARDRYKVVVLDEVHRLSRQAFDALLKIVEEPPPYLVFIFATTEIEAVPATILSRCQEFQFRRVSAAAVAALLRQICESESIHASDSALRLVARAGEGSVRDAVALLDQLATFGSGTLSDEAAVRLLGGLDIALFRRLLEAILAGDAAGVVREVRHIEDEGWDPRHVFGQFLAYCRDALHLALGGDPAQVDLALEEAQALAALARGGGYENLLRLLNQLLASEPIVRRTETGALALEIAWLRAAELPKLVRVEQLLAGGGADPSHRPSAAPAAHGAPAGSASAANPGPARPHRPPSPAAMPVAPGPAAPSAPAAPAKAMQPSPAASTAPAAQAGPEAGQAAPTAPAPATQASPATQPSPPAPAAADSAAPLKPAGAVAPATAQAAPGNGKDLQGDAATQHFLEEVAARKQPLAAHLEQAAILRFEAGRLLILLPPGDAYLSSRLRQAANRETIAAAVAQTWGSDASWDFAEGPTPTTPKTPTTPMPLLAPTTAPGAAATASAGPQPAELSAAVLSPAVQTLLDIFGGKVEAVEEHRGSREE
ncbi:MAG TPA: DNA polymerase III subunit gamma/tau [Thermoanaerobaculia bacterium]|nr:DNA polymerase III subunit gamma/tau [Thermoanaerobaculia bacterium]